MGSLPNLHELEEIEHRREKRREREHREQLREQRARDSSRERERMALFAQRKVSERRVGCFLFFIEVIRKQIIWFTFINQMMNVVYKLY